MTGLALDSAGVPGIAFVGNGDNGLAEGFWRPGNASSVLAMDNRGYQTDDPDVKLTFFGTQPRLIFAGAADDNYFADYSHTIWVTTSPDGGASWTNAVNNLDEVACGEPKLSQSTDMVRWTTCGLATYGAPKFSATYPVVLFGGNDKLWVSFQQANDFVDLPVGITVWREPPAWVFPPPPPQQ